MSKVTVKQLQRYEDQYRKLEKFFEKDGLDEQEKATLRSIRSQLDQLRRAVSDKPSLTMEDDEAETITVKQVALGPIRWNGKYRGKLWGLTDTNGALVRGGPTVPLKDMAQVNRMGERALEIINTLEERYDAWHGEYGRLQQSAENARRDLKKMEKAIPAIKRRNKNDDFQDDMNNYVDAKDAAESAVAEVRIKDNEFKAAAYGLEKTINDLELHKAQKAYEVAQEKVDQLKEDIEAAKGIFHAVIDIATKIAEQDWQGLATDAISYLGEKSIEIEYEPQLKQLEKELKGAETKVGTLQTEGLVLAIKEAREDLSAAAGKFKKSQDDLQRALKKFARMQTNARHELNESSSTRVVARLITQRSKQLQMIATVNKKCAHYLDEVAVMTQFMTRASHQYSLGGSWLDKMSKKDPKYNSDTKYGKMIERSCLSNAVEIDQWGAWVRQAQRQCEAAENWTNLEGEKGPMGPFDKMMKLLQTGLT